MSEKIAELNQHKPSVESVISRLDRFQGKIKHITAVVEWEDGSLDVVHDEKDVSHLCYESVLLGEYVGDFVYDRGDE